MPISSFCDIAVYNSSFMINSPPKIMLLSIDFDEDFIDVEGVAIASVLSLEALCIQSSKLDAPQANCFTADDDASFGQEIFDIAVAQVETIVKPDCVGDDIWWESVAFACTHVPILSI